MEMDIVTIQSHLNTTIQSWSRLQNILKDGEVEIDGKKLDIPSVIAVAWFVNQNFFKRPCFGLMVIVIIAYRRLLMTRVSLKKSMPAYGF